MPIELNVAKCFFNSAVGETGQSKKMRDLTMRKLKIFKIQFKRYSKKDNFLGSRKIERCSLLRSV